ncbi:MAG TPA: Dabb family protein [Acidimicrobiales bacterium]|nr:Dabb family protein [Acidimicrobiales bacterium]
MLRHTVVFRWRLGIPSGDVDEVTAALRRLPSTIPELRAYHVGRDAGLTGGNWDFAVVADFDDAAGWRAYLDHPAHQEALARIRAMAEERAAVQYEF